MAFLKALLGTALYLLVHSSSASIIATFEDAKCKDLKESINGPNGYPNGTCTRLDKKGSYKSFQVDGLDEGCSVTLYGKDSDPESPCSSETQLEFPHIGTCYNASWVYFSIDFCDPPDTSSSSSISRVSNTPTASSTPSTTSSSGTPTATSKISSKSSHKNNTGEIVGGVVGGAVGLALVVALVLFSVKRNRRMQQEVQVRALGTAPQELPTQNEKHEIYSHEASVPPQEMGRNSVYIPPSELDSDTMKREAGTGSVSDAKRQPSMQSPIT